MSTSLLTAAFGAADGGPWGAAWSAPEPLLFLGGRAVAPIAFAGDGDAEPWHLSADGFELELAPAAEAVQLPDGEGFEQLCRVTGSATVDGTAVALDCLGRRGGRSALELDDCDSIRDVSAWFEPDQGLAVVSLRPRKARGHDRDANSGAVLDPEAPQPVADARLSTTYDEHGAPIRAGFELWLGPADQEHEQYPRRAAGEALGTAARHRTGGLELWAVPMRWHSRGLDGAGVYVLARAR